MLCTWGKRSLPLSWTIHALSLFPAKTPAAWKIRVQHIRQAMMRVDCVGIQSSRLRVQGFCGVGNNQRGIWHPFDEMARLILGLRNPGSQTPNPSMHQRVYANPMPRFPNPKSVSVPARTRQPSNLNGLGGLYVRRTPVCFASQVGLALGHQVSCLAPKRFPPQNETSRRGLRSDVGINIGGSIRDQ